MKRRIVIFTDTPGWHGARLVEALSARSCEVHTIALQDCRFDLEGVGHGIVLPGFEHEFPDGVFVRGVPGGTLEEVVFYLDILHALAEAGVPVYNSGRAIERSVDKGMTSFLLRHARVPTPPCWVLTGQEQAGAKLKHEIAAGHELVCKPLFGSQGNGLQRLGVSDDLPAAADCDGVYYLQRFIDTGEGAWHDWRVFVVGGHALAAMRRNGASWISNVAAGAECQPAVLDDKLRSLAEAAVGALSMNYAGVDIIRDADGGYWVIEVNSIPAWKGLQSTCNLDVAAVLIDDFLEFCDRHNAVEATA